MSWGCLHFQIVKFKTFLFKISIGGLDYTNNFFRQKIYTNVVFDSYAIPKHNNKFVSISSQNEL